jgi:hypothetical protein
MQTVSLRYISPLEFTELLSDNLVYSTVYAFIGMLILSIVKFGNFELLSTHQRCMNHAAVILLAAILTVAIGYLFEYYVLGEELAKQLVAFIALRVLISILLYFLLVVSFILFVSKMKNDESELEPIENSKSENIDLQEKHERKVIDQVAIKAGTKIHVILIPDIIYIQADGDYVQIFCMSGRFMKEQTLKYFEEHLPDNLFVRVHRSSIVNVQSILRIELYDKQSQQLALKNGHQIKISQSGFKLLRTKLNL